MASPKIDQSITVLPADKVGATAVLGRNANIQKAENSRSGEATHKALPCDSTAKQVASISLTNEPLVGEINTWPPLEMLHPIRRIQLKIR